MIERRDLAVQIAWEFYGLPYRWGGDDSVVGFDCSGMAVEILKSTGVLPHTGDWTANDLWLRFRGVRDSQPRTGYLVFYGTASKIIHVEFCLDGMFSIGASGGGSSLAPPDPTGDPIIDRLDRLLWLLGDEAAKLNAYVKVRPIRRRTDLVGYVDPFRNEEDHIA